MPLKQFNLLTFVIGVPACTVFFEEDHISTVDDNLNYIHSEQITEVIHNAPFVYLFQ